ncbi:unnamed protein product, partial [Clonostachys rhizophaga]
MPFRRSKRPLGHPARTVPPFPPGPAQANASAEGGGSDSSWRQHNIEIPPHPAPSEESWYDGVPPTPPPGRPCQHTFDLP